MSHNPILHWIRLKHCAQPRAVNVIELIAAAGFGASIDNRVSERQKGLLELCPTETLTAEVGGDVQEGHQYECAPRAPLHSLENFEEGLPGRAP